MAQFCLSVSKDNHPGLPTDHIGTFPFFPRPYGGINDSPSLTDQSSPARRIYSYTFSYKMAPFSKPETVLKQAEGLVSVGQTSAALQSLTEMFQSSKKLKSTPLASLEPIMLRFVELCVEMRKGRTAKEGLMHTRTLHKTRAWGASRT